jgi:hypothetical protein
MSDQQSPIDAALSRLRANYTPGAGRPSEDVAEPVEALGDEHPAEMPDELFWPPFRLEPIHGMLSRVAFEFTIGSAILLFAFRFTMAAPVVLSIAFLFLVLCFARARQLLLHVHNAVGIGYPRRLVWQVAADSSREMALILEGKGPFTGITPAEVTRVAALRVNATSLFAAGSLWIPLVFPWIVILGFMGILRDRLVWLLLLAVPVALFVAAIRLRYREYHLKRKFRAPESLAHETAMQVAAWSQLHQHLGWPRTKPRDQAEVRVAMGATWLAAFFLLIPLALAGVMNVIPWFVSSNAPSDAAAVRSASLAALQKFRLDADSSISSAEAGRALHSLTLVGRNAPRGMQPVSTALPPVFPNPAFTRETNPEFWPERLFEMMRSGLTPAQRALVDSAAAHPGNTLLARIARAPAIDIAASRWDFAMADTMALRELPFIGGREMRYVGHAHIAQAALQFASGQTARADTTLREIISAGFLLRNSSDASDASNGSQLIRMGATALASLYNATGNAEEAGRIRGSLLTADIAVHGLAPRNSRSIDDLRRYVLARRNPMAARWDAFIMLQTAAPCLSFYNAVFGPDEEHEQWVRDARAALVQAPADSAYFEMVSKGASVKRRSDEPRCTRSVLRGYREILMGY